MFLIGVCCGCIPTLLVLLYALTRFRRQFDRLTREAVSTGAQLTLVMLAHEAENALNENAKTELWSIITAQNEQLAKALRTVEMQENEIRRQQRVLRAHNTGSSLH